MSYPSRKGRGGNNRPAWLPLRRLFSVGLRSRADEDDKTASSSFRDDAEAPYRGTKTLPIGLKNPCSICLSPFKSHNTALRSYLGSFVEREAPRRLLTFLCVSTRSNILMTMPILPTKPQPADVETSNDAASD